MVKLTGWPRIGYLNEIFPDAIFIHLIRDGRDVANSFLKIADWAGWQGKWGPLPPEFELEWNESGGSYVALAGLYWRLMVHAAQTAKTQVSENRFTEVRYEDFARDPLGTYKQIADICGLEWNPYFEESIKRQKIVYRGGAWESDLTLHQKALLTDVTRPKLLEYNYI